MYRIRQKPLPLVYLENTLKFWKTAKHMANQFERESLLENFLRQEGEQEGYKEGQL